MVVGFASRPAAPASFVGFGMAENISTADTRSFEKHKVGLGATMAVADVATYFGAQHRTYKILSADKAFMTDLHGSPVVLIGEPGSNPWIFELQRALRYQFAPLPDGTLRIVDQKSTGPGNNWGASYQGSTQIVSTDYSIVACFQNNVTDAPLIMLAGLNGFGVGTAGEVAASPDMIRAITAMAPKNWTGWQFEAVIRTDVLQSHPGHVQVVATYFW
jgi:hypothetical protein